MLSTSPVSAPVSSSNLPEPNDELKSRLRNASTLLSAKPHLDLEACVVVPVRNEEANLADLIHALADQRDSHGRRLQADACEVILLLNNCTDGSHARARQLQCQHPDLNLHLATVSFPPSEAHVGKARQLVFDLALARFQSLARPRGLILTTDADTCPASDWINQNQTEIAKGVDAVAGRILLKPEEASALPASVRRLFLIDIGYRRALEEMRSLYDPEAHDPFPRHHQNFGGSFAVTAAAYHRAGGMPLRPYREDVGLYQALVDTGALVRHSETVRVYTSARMTGRARGGLADAIGWWNRQVAGHAPILVESARAAEQRLKSLGRWRRDNPELTPPTSLITTPDEPPPGEAAEVYLTLITLRERIASLRKVPWSKRLNVSSAAREL